MVRVSNEDEVTECNYPIGSKGYIAINNFDSDYDYVCHSIGSEPIFAFKRPNQYIVCPCPDEENYVAVGVDCILKTKIHPNNIIDGVVICDNGDPFENGSVKICVNKLTQATGNIPVCTSKAEYCQTCFIDDPRYFNPPNLFCEPIYKYVNAIANQPKPDFPPNGECVSWKNHLCFEYYKVVGKITIHGAPAVQCKRKCCGKFDRSFEPVNFGRCVDFNEECVGFEVDCSRNTFSVQCRQGCNLDQI